MALDTADKRSSAIGVGLPWRPMLPLPDGALDQGDRQHAGYAYRGILAEAPPSVDEVDYACLEDEFTLFSDVTSEVDVVSDVTSEASIFSDVTGEYFRCEGDG